MATLADKIKVALDEIRMLVLGTQVLISLEFELCFQSGFGQAPRMAQQLVVVGLLLLLATFILLLWGPAFHRIVGEGRCTDEVHRFMTNALRGALWPLAAALGLDLFIAFDALAGLVTGIVAGTILVALCVGLWNVMSHLARHSTPHEVTRMKDDPHRQQQHEMPQLHEQVSQALTEARIVLPGAQAMLGFQFVTVFEKQFTQLPTSAKLVHLASLSLIAITVVLLMTPAAFHRIAEGGEDSHRLVRLTSRFVVAAMVPLAAGMAGDVFVVVGKITGSPHLALACALGAFALAMALWFGYTAARRKTRRLA